mgnify:CR=1 FL=1
MGYRVEKTAVFEKWLRKLTTRKDRYRILARLDMVSNGHFGDHKQIGERLFELRMFFGPGYRIYFTIFGNTVVYLLAGGDKSSQQKDIEKARNLLKELEE